MLLRNDGALEVSIAPRFRSIVRDEDWAYIETLLRDLKERARLEPEHLFRQLSSLSVGPLVCEISGARIENNRSLVEITAGFERFD